MLSHRRRAAPLAAGVVALTLAGNGHVGSAASAAATRYGVPAATADLPERSLIAAALSQLTPEHRIVIVRACYRGESVAELAAALDVPQGTVKSRLHHGLRALRLALQENGVTGLHHEQLCRPTGSVDNEQVGCS